jgi:ribulose-phosphate 3-epimerase
MLQDVLIAPSILSADLLDMRREIESIQTADFVHFDVMDGVFVPNLTFGPGLLAQIKEATDLPVDVHLMISDPDRRYQAYLDAGADLVCFHYEAQLHAHRTLYAIKDAGARGAIAINPGTPVSVLESLIEDVDMVLLMSVNPGYGGQSFIDGTYRKLRQLVDLCDERGVQPLIEVDGGVAAHNVEEVCAAGANVIVAGSSVFGAPNHGAAVEQLRELGRRGLARRS